MAHPSFGRTLTVRGLDMFDTPPIARWPPSFAHEPLLRGVTAVCEPFCGAGNLGDGDAGPRHLPCTRPIFSRGAQLRRLDFFDMAAAPCPVLGLESALQPGDGVA